MSQCPWNPKKSPVRMDHIHKFRIIRIQSDFSVGSKKQRECGVQTYWKMKNSAIEFFSQSLLRRKAFNRISFHPIECQEIANNGLKTEKLCKAFCTENLHIFYVFYIKIKCKNEHYNYSGMKVLWGYITILYILKLLWLFCCVIYQEFSYSRFQCSKKLV